VSTRTEIDERVTCSSCQFRYPRIRGFCPLCGIPAPVNKAAFQPGNAADALTQTPKKPAHILAPMMLLICASLCMVRSDKAPNDRSPTATIAGTFSPAADKIQPLRRVLPSETAARVASSSAQNVWREMPLRITDDPAELWKKVRTGSADAEIELAKLYLDGKGVTQNCEQAHLLLLAASRKHSSAASEVLSGDYVQRCR
jgi:TPR repeat protein